MDKSGQRSLVSLSLETTRLLLPPLDRTHAAALARIYQDDEVARYIGGSALTAEGTRVQVDTFERDWREHGYGQSAVIERSTGQLIGRVGLHHWPVWDAVGLGYVIRRDRQGLGFALEASRAWVHWAQDNLDRDELIAVIHPENHTSKALAAHLGFVYDRDEVTPKGIDVCVYRRGLLHH